MSADFLPLAVGNRWIYDVLNEDGRKISELDFAVQEHTIISGRSFYVLTRFPFVPEDSGIIHLVRYDRQEREFVRVAQDEEGPLFLADGTSTEVIEKDNGGLPVKFILHTDTMALTFQRGVGIVEARIQGGNGIQIARINSARIGEGRGAGGAPLARAPTDQPAVPTIPPPKPPDQKAKEVADSVTTITEENPRLTVEAAAAQDGTKFTLTVTNTSDKLLPFNFTTGQTYDFAVIDPGTGQEIWRWSRTEFFTQVKRSESIRPKLNWKFEVTWNHRDNDQNPVPPGSYRVVGIIATRPPMESQDLTFEVK
jgi:hypothetical protein